MKKYSLIVMSMLLIIGACSKEGSNSSGGSCSEFKVTIHHSYKYNLEAWSTGGVTFKWSNGEVGKYLRNLDTGVYSVVATRNDGCVAKDTFRLERQITEFKPKIVCINDNSCTISPYVEDSNGNQITESGICFGSSINPTIQGTKYVNDNSSTSGIVIENLAPATTYHIRSYAIDQYGVSYGEDIPITTNSGPSPYTIGQEHEGGIIAGISCDGQHGFVIAENLNNTYVNGRVSHYLTASQACEGLLFNGYDDWQLPTGNQMREIYTNIHITGKLDIFPKEYWTRNSYKSEDKANCIYGGSAVQYSFQTDLFERVCTADGNKTGGMIAIREF